MRQCRVTRVCVWCPGVTLPVHCPSHTSPLQYVQTLESLKNSNSELKERNKFLEVQCGAAGDGG